ncbi:hypothetical protein CIG19_11100 [Enterobacterales bacterium CwR94]|nr:hypothetical protein CIG19_11100 [Enterobacterales bacterium CwR94]
MIITENGFLREGIDHLIADSIKSTPLSVTPTLYIEIHHLTDFYLLPALLSRVTLHFGQRPVRVALITRCAALLALAPMKNYIINIEKPLSEIAQHVAQVHTQYTTSLPFAIVLHRHCRALIMTPMELRIAEMIAAGRGVHDIARCLDRSIKTVYNHIANMRTMTDTRSLARLVTAITQQKNRIDDACHQQSQLVEIQNALRIKWLRYAKEKCRIEEDIQAFFSR